MAPDITTYWEPTIFGNFLWEVLLQINFRRILQKFLQNHNKIFMIKSILELDKVIIPHKDDKEYAMNNEKEILKFLLIHLDSIFQNDIRTYHETTSKDLSLYEWFVTPHRIDGLPFHDFMMNETARRGQVFGIQASDELGEINPNTRYDLSNLKIQDYGHAAIASYTILLSVGTSDGVNVASHNESRVMVKQNGNWQVVHVHKSPSWSSSYMPPETL